MKSGPRLPQLEKALAQKRRPNIVINQSINQSIFKRKNEWEMDTWKRGKVVTQVGKQFIQKAVYIWNASHVFLKENRICAELYKKQSNEKKSITGQVEEELKNPIWKH